MFDGFQVTWRIVADVAKSAPGQNSNSAICRRTRPSLESAETISTE